MKQSWFLALLLSLSTAQAADYSKVIWRYVRGEAAVPDTQHTAPSGDQTRNWLSPAGLPVQALTVAYSPQISTNTWLVMLAGASARPADLLGTSQWAPYTKRRLPRTPGSHPVHLYELKGGLFRGLIFGEHVTPAGKRTLMLVTPGGLSRLLDYGRQGQ